MQATNVAAAAIFGATFLLLALGRIGRFPIQRGVAAVLGGVATAILLGLSPAVIDLQVILLLAGLMVLAALAETAGVFAGFRHRLLLLPPGLAMWICTVLVALTSAALLNDAAVVVLVPFLIPPLRNLGLPLAPAVILLAASANVGSLLTPFGNPQNAVLAAHAGLGVIDFLRVQGPIVVAGMALLGAASWWLGRRAMVAEQVPFPSAVAHGQPWMITCILAFLAGSVAAPHWHVGLGSVAALAAATSFVGMRLVVGARADRAAWKGLDWNVLALFVGLYFLTAGLAIWFPAAQFALARFDSPLAAMLGTIALSLSVGNVPAILTFVHLDPTWTRLHAPFLVTVSTLGGALLLTGSAASLLAADAARRHGVEVRFLVFMRWAVPWVLPVLLLGAWLTWGVSGA